MKVATLSLGLLALLTPLVSAWSKEDREIFRIRDELITHEGSNITFYDFLSIRASASQDEINKAYKKKSRSLHPDKVKQQLTAERTKAAKNAGGTSPSSSRKGLTQSEIKAAVKLASDRQARLSIITNVLRGPGRERYDHFLANGFPVWKGTEYYYQRYRPGLGTVIAGLFLFAGGGAHYLALYMGWKRRREFVERYIKFARHAAWGESMAVPGLDGSSARAAAVQEEPSAGEDQRAVAVNRKQRRMQERDAKLEAASAKLKGKSRKVTKSSATSGAATPVPASAGPTGAKRRVVAENGKVLVVDSLGDVYLEQQDEEGHTHEFLLDPEELPMPTISDTALVRVPKYAYSLTVGRLLAKKATDESEDAELSGEEKDVDAESDSEEGKRTPSTGSGDDGFEMLDKSVDDLGVAKSTGTQAPRAKTLRRKSKKR